MLVKIEDVIAARKFLSSVNDVSLEDLELWKNGQKVDVCPRVVNEWKFVGLSNVDFIIDEMYNCENTIYEVLG